MIKEGRLSGRYYIKRKEESIITFVDPLKLEADNTLQEIVKIQYHSDAYVVKHVITAFIHGKIWLIQAIEPTLEIIIPL